MEYRILGPVEVWDRGQRLALGGRQQRTLLAVLLLNANRVVGTDRLVEELWSDRPLSDARSLLRGCVVRLRRTLGGNGCAGGHQRLVTHPSGYLLKVRPGELDLARFEELTATAQRMAAEQLPAGLERARELLAEALELWRGPALADLTTATCQAQAVRLEEHRLATVEQSIDVDLYLGRNAHVIGELQLHLIAQPLRERLWAQLILALHAANRQADALAAARRLRDILDEQLGVEPDAMVQAVERAILSGDDALGVYRRAFGARPVGSGPAVGPGSGTARAPSVTPRQLPAQVVGFTGRGEQLKRLDALLATETGAMAVATITGTAGVGKTTLAVQWAHQVQDRFPDGQLFVNLRGHAPAAPMPPIEALAGFLQALGVPAGQVPVTVDQAAGLYRSLLAGRRLLILLDNARTAEQVRPLLPGSGTCLVLVTSREELGGLVAREGAQLVSLDVLDPDEAHVLFARILGHDRVRGEPAAISELAEACAFLPLALRIAAANLVADLQRPIADYVAELTAGNRLDRLTVNGDEYTGVRATFDLSYTSLAPAEQRVFRLLGLVPGPDVTAAAAAALVGAIASETSGILDRLASAHLIGRPTAGRYAFHDLLRAYAADRSDGEDSAAQRAAALQRLHDWYLSTVDTAAQLIYPSWLRLPKAETGPVAAQVPAFAGYDQALAWLDVERPNLIAAIVQAAAHGLNPSAWRLADALRGYLFLRMAVVDLMVAATAAQAAAETDGDQHAQAAVHLCLGDAHRCQGRFLVAAEHYGQALDLCERTGWLAGQAASLNLLGAANWESARLAEAAACIERSLAINRRIGRLHGEAATLGNLGLIYLYQGRLALAADHYAQALVLNEGDATPARSAHSLGILALAQHGLGHLDQARDHLLRALAVHRELDDHGGEADNLRALAEVHRDAGRLGEARQAALTALALVRDIQDRRYRARCLNTLASVHQSLGQHTQAVEHYRQALDLAREIHSRYPEVTALIGLATGYLHLSQPDQAYASAEEALTLASLTGYRVCEGQALTALANIHLHLGQNASALACAQRAIAVHRDTGHRLGQARALLVLGHVRRAADGATAATGPWQQALAMFTDVGTPEAEPVRSLLGLTPTGPTPQGSPAAWSRGIGAAGEHAG